MQHRLSTFKKSARTVDAKSPEKTVETVEVHIQEMDDDESMDKMRQVTSANADDLDEDNQ